MTLLDAYGIVAFLTDEPGAASEVEAILREGDAHLLAVNLAESVDVARRIHGVSVEQVRESIEPLFAERVLVPLASGPAHGWLAGEIRAAHYDRKTSALSIADSFLLAHAELGGDAVATADRPIASVARSRGVAVRPLPDTTGVRP